MCVFCLVADCKSRWKSLRDQYNKKIKEGSGTGSARLNCTWQYINLMSFLSDAPERRRSIARGIAVNDSQTSITNTELNTGIDSDGDNTQTTVTEVNTGLNSEYEANAENIPTTQVNVDDTDEPPPGPSTSKKRKPSKLQETLDKRESQRLNLLEALVNNTQKQPQVQPPSATKKFFESMAEVVETFPPREQAIIRAKVCQLITDVEIKLSTGTPMPEHSWDSDYFNL